MEVEALSVYSNKNALRVVTGHEKLTVKVMAATTMSSWQFRCSRASGGIFFLSRNYECHASQ